MPTVLAPAKVNLTLHVLGRRPDGYHELESLIAFAAVGDRIALRPAATASLAVSGPFAAALASEADADNLAWRAAAGFAAAFGGAEHAIQLEKHLPVAAGIGGGSADAAAVLRLLADQGGIALDEPRLAAVARQLGADVPAALCNRPCIVSGFGEVVNPLPRFPTVPAVLVNPGVGVPTGQVFARWRDAAVPPPVDTGWRAAIADAEDAGALAEALAGTCNMLEEPAREIAPEIGTVLGHLRGCDGCLLARMSGSGATCFGLFADARAASAAVDQLTTAASGWWVVATRLVGWPGDRRGDRVGST